MTNPLLQDFKTPYQLPPFDKIREEHFEKAIDHALAEARKEIEDITHDKAIPSFENVIESLERSSEKLNRNASILFNLNAAETNDHLQKITQEVSPKLSTFHNEVKQNELLFKKVSLIYESMDSWDANREKKQLLKETYLDFVRRGAGLSGKKKQRFKEIDAELTKLSFKFSKNVLAETNAYELVIDNESDLSGLPDDVKTRAADMAQQKGKKDQWIFTLHAPSYIPFMDYADNRSLREKFYKASMSRCFKGDDKDNQGIILKTVQLRAEMAELLGYSSFADYILEQRMAETPEKVKQFMNDLLNKSLPKAKQEVDEIKDFMASSGIHHKLQRWDWAYYSEKLRKTKYHLDDEVIKPYFKLENVIEGAFATAEKLFDLSFIPNNNLPKYHSEVQTYEVKDSNGNVIAIFLADFFPRKGKREGAWMTSYRNEKKVNGQRIIPQVSIVCNFPPSNHSHPSLLKFDEVKTLFHEFGHALHGMLADTTYESLAGTNVYWDFVEFPSQIMENWCYEKDCLNLFAKHFFTGELIPTELVEKIKKAATYHKAFSTVRQLSFAWLDMAWHSFSLDQAKQIRDVNIFEKQTLALTKLFPEVPYTNMSAQFSHIFAGGYAAGYYSYKWAEVLDADAFSLFQEKGIFDKETSCSFKEHILSKGGTEHPMKLYKRFRGKEPSMEALLKRTGLT